jgi:hypothetical protein
MRDCDDSDFVNGMVLLLAQMVSPGPSLWSFPSFHLSSKDTIIPNKMYHKRHSIHDHVCHNVNTRFCPMGALFLIPEQCTKYKQNRCFMWNLCYIHPKTTLSVSVSTLVSMQLEYTTSDITVKTFMVRDYLGDDTPRHKVEFIGNKIQIASYRHFL